MSEPVPIEHGVPMPLVQRRRARQVRWPIAELEIGDSFLAPGDRLQSVRSLLSRHRRTHPDFAWTYRREGAQVRFWRTA